MPSGKDRLYLALYARGGKYRMADQEDRYHWAFIIGPKRESKSSRGKRFHVKEILKPIGDPPSLEPQWILEETQIPMESASMILIRVLVGKVKDMDRLRSVFQHTPLRPKTPTWNWVEWVKEAFLRAAQDDTALGACETNWEYVRDTAMWYVASKKAAHRFDGIVRHDMSLVPTWDILKGVETLP